jgi:YfiR/HmsC-like
VAEYGSHSTGVQLLLREGRGHIVINHTLARREGADFSSQLLRVAEVVE